ncbi:major facilitator superfamily domain-containing protein [Trichoderma velutinum]
MAPSLSCGTLCVIINILPLMGIYYMLQLMDKVFLSYATQLGILTDLRDVVNILLWIPLLEPLGSYLASTVVLWGAVLMCHAATKDYAGLMTVRFFLGVTEAAVSPGFSLIVGLIYKREELQARRTTSANSMLIWFSENAAANILSGAVTTFWGIVLVFLRPSSPSEAKFLTADKRALHLQRTIAKKTGILEKSKAKTSQMMAGLLDPQAWLLFLIMFTVSVANGGISALGSIIAASIGCNPLKAVLMQMPSAGFQLGAMLLSSILAAYLHLSLITSNVGVFTNRSTVSGIFFAAYCIGNIAGPQFYSTDQAPRYSKGDMKHGLPADVSGSDELGLEVSNKTDRELPDFRYVL